MSEFIIAALNIGILKNTSISYSFLRICTIKFKQMFSVIMIIMFENGISHVLDITFFFDLQCLNLFVNIRDLRIGHESRIFLFNDVA